MLMLIRRRLLYASLTYPQTVVSPSTLAHIDDAKVFRNSYRIEEPTRTNLYQTPHRDFKFRSKFDTEDKKEKSALNDGGDRKGLPDPSGFFDKAIGMLYGLRYGATWFLYFTNAETRIRRLFGMKEAVDSSYTGQMKAKMKSMFGGA